MIDSVDLECLKWAIEVRRRDNAGSFYPLEAYPDYNYSHNPVGLTETVAELSQALFLMRTHPSLTDAHNALVIHYLFSGNAAAKADMLGMSLAKYWRFLSGGHYYLARTPETV